MANQKTTLTEAQIRQAAAQFLGQLLRPDPAPQVAPPAAPELLSAAELAALPAEGVTEHAARLYEYIGRRAVRDRLPLSPFWAR